jgi:hypothetical protein
MTKALNIEVTMLGAYTTKCSPNQKALAFFVGREQFAGSEQFAGPRGFDDPIAFGAFDELACHLSAPNFP